MGGSTEEYATMATKRSSDVVSERNFGHSARDR